MFAKSWARVAIVSVGAFALLFGGHEKPMSAAPVPAPTPREKIADEAWLPKRTPPQESVELPSAFPDLVPPSPNKDAEDKDRMEKYRTAYMKACPRLFGTIVLKIEANDGTLQKLLKARLHQSTLEFQAIESEGWSNCGPSERTARYSELLLDVQSTATELWAKQPKELVPWLEELLIASKDWERRTHNRIINGTTAPSEYYAAKRLRLKLEAELWKAKHAR